MKKKPYSEKQIDKSLQSLSDWTVSRSGKQLNKTFTFQNFVAGLSFCAKIAVHAEVMGHHPDLALSYGKVKVSLTTHDANGLTKLDFDLAKRIDKLN